MTKIEELRSKMRKLRGVPIVVKFAAAEELMQCAVELLEQQEARIQALESINQEEEGEE